MKNKLNAFTLMETLIVMVVIFVVIASVFSVFLLVNTYFGNYQKDKKETNEFIVFDKTIENEVFEADSLLLGENQELNIYIDDKKVSYHLLDTTIIRSEILSDTFYVVLLDKNIHFVNENSFLIDQIKLKVLVNNDEITAVYSKRYAADTYLKYAIRN